MVQMIRTVQAVDDETVGIKPRDMTQVRKYLKDVDNLQKCLGEMKARK